MRTMHGLDGHYSLPGSRVPRSVGSSDRFSSLFSGDTEHFERLVPTER